jgi:hypothetical protein
MCGGSLFDQVTFKECLSQRIKENPFRQARFISPTVPRAFVPKNNTGSILTCIRREASSISNLYVGSRFEPVTAAGGMRIFGAVISETPEFL